MALGINLHAFVRPIITALNPDIAAYLYRSMSETLDPSGAAVNVYSEPTLIYAQVQSEKASELYHQDRVGTEEISRRFYLHSLPTEGERVASLIREIGRTGDIFQIAPWENWFPGRWWLITATEEDFTRPGWIAVRAELQINPPDNVTPP